MGGDIGSESSYRVLAYRREGADGSTDGRGCPARWMGSCQYAGWGCDVLPCCHREDAGGKANDVIASLF